MANQLLKYSSFVEDFQKDSDEEGDFGNIGIAEIPVQRESHFEKFEINFRKKESKEEVKEAISIIEKEALLLSLIPIAFNEELESEVQIASLLVETPNAINIIWDFILISFRFFGEPEGIQKCYFAEYKRLDKFFVENSTLPVADSELIIDIFKHCVNINKNLLERRDITISNTDLTTARIDTDVVMQESVLPRVSETPGSSSFVNLILSKAETQMDNWKPAATKIMQEFQDFDNEGFDVSKCLFDVVQNAKLRFMTCKEVFLFGLDFTEAASAANWSGRTVQSYKAFALPETFEELQNIPLDKPYNFLMSLDKESIDKEITRLGVEALMFWELPKVEIALNELCQKWFFNECGALIKGTIDLSKTTPAPVTDPISEPLTTISSSKKEQCVELGFVEKLVELWRLRRKILESKAEILVSGCLAKYNYKAGETIMNKTMMYKSSYMYQLFKARNMAITKEERNRAALLMYDNYICQYKALLLQCERDFDLMINVRLYQEIVLPYFQIKHGQFAAVALVRSGANKMLRKVWEAYIIRRDRIVLREHQKNINDQRRFDIQLKNAQQSAGQQIDNRVDKSLAGLDAKVKSIIKETVKSQSIKKEAISFDSSLLECDLTNTGHGQFSSSQPSHPLSSSKRSRLPETIDLSSPGYARNTKRQDFRNESGKVLQPGLQSKDSGEYFERVEFFDPRETPYSPINPPTYFKKQSKQKHQARGAAQAARPPANSERKHFAQDSREKSGRGDGRPNSKPPGMNDPYGIDIAPLNIFENQIVPVGVHNLSKTFRPNMATIRVLSLGTKFIPKWRDANLKFTFRKFEDFKRRLQNKMYFLETSPGTFCLDKQFHLKNFFMAKESYNEIDEFCWQLRDGINDVIENQVKFDFTSNLSGKEKRALHKLITEKNKIHVINDTDKNLGPANADKSDVISECKRQLFDVSTYLKLSKREMETFLTKSIEKLRRVVEYHFYLGNCSQKEKEFLLSNVQNYVIPHFYIIWKILKNPPVGRPIVAGYKWIFTPASIFVGHFLKEFYSKFDSILNDSLSLVKLLEISRFDKNCFLFTIDFKSLYTNIPVDDAIKSIKQLCFDFQNVIPNAHFIIELLDLVLNSSLMTFDGEFFQQIFGLIMGTNVAPILTNIYMAMLENELKVKCETDSKLIWPVLFKRFIDDGFGITKGVREDVVYWIEKFNELRKTVQIDKYNWGNALEYMDLFIYKSDPFYLDGKLSISIHQKETNKFMYIPFRSFHQRHTIKNFVWNELKRYVRFNTEEKNFKKLKTRFFLRLRNRGYRKYVLKKLFQHVTYSQRNKLLNTELSFPNVCQPLTIQEAERRIVMEGEAVFSLSQENEEISSLRDSILNSTTNNNSNSSAQEDTRNQGHHLRVVSTEDSQRRPRQRVCLVLPGYMQKVKRSMDLFLKKSVAKFSCRSKRFAKLAADVNICIVLENERNLKKLLVKTKIV